jgi:hypothetical protein
MKKCCRCDREFDTPGIRCGECRCGAIAQKYYYHGTVFENLDGILAGGLSPNVERIYNAERGYNADLVSGVPGPMARRIFDKYGGAERFFEERQKSVFITSQREIAAEYAFQGVANEIYRDFSIQEPEAFEELKRGGLKYTEAFGKFLINNIPHVSSDWKLRFMTLKIRIPPEARPIPDELAPLFMHLRKGIRGGAFRIVGGIPAEWIEGYFKNEADLTRPHVNLRGCGYTRLNRTPEGEMEEMVESGEAW